MSENTELKKPSESSMLDTLGKSLALAVALMPIVGGLIRFLDFSAVRFINNPMELALSSSLSVLSITGVLGAIPAAGFIVYGLFFWWPSMLMDSHFLRRFDSSIREIRNALDDAKDGEDIEEIDRKIHSLEEGMKTFDQRNRLARRLPRIPKWLVPVIGMALWFPLVLFLPGWPTVILATVGSLISLIYIDFLAKRTGEIRFGNIWPLILINLAISMAIAAFNGLLVGTTVSSYKFDHSDIQVADGVYQELNDGTVTFLISCIDSSREVIGVKSDLILQKTPLHTRPDTQPSLYQAVFGNKPTPIGFQVCK